MSEAPAPWRATRAHWIAILAVAALLAGLAVRNAAQALLRPAGEVLLWPGDGAALAVAAQRRVAVTGEVDAPARALLRAALVRAPLLAEPLALAARDAAARADTARAERLMLAARARDPRLLPVRMWLLDRYARTGRLDAALMEAGVVARIAPGTQPQLIDMMGVLATQPAGQAALTRALARQPAWRTAFFLTVSRGLSNPAILLAMQRAAPPPDGNAASAERRAVYEAMIATGDGARARADWARRLPGGAGAMGTIVYDGGFAGLPGEAPFNWSLTDARGGVARRVAGGLALEASGARPVMLADQVVVLAPGRYRLSATARRTGAANDSALEVQLQCIDSGDMARMTIDAMGARPIGRALSLAIGDACPVARVRLVAQPGDTGAALRALVSSVAITRQ